MLSEHEEKSLLRIGKTLTSKSRCLSVLTVLKIIAALSTLADQFTESITLQY